MPCASSRGNHGQLPSPRHAFSTEVAGTENLLQAAFEGGVDRFVFISSTAVYGVPDRCPIVESHDRVGVGAYGRAKMAAEDLCAAHGQRGRPSATFFAAGIGALTP